MDETKEIPKHRRELPPQMYGQLELRIKYVGDVVMMELVNRQHAALCAVQLKRILALAGMATAYFSWVILLNEDLDTIWQARILYPAAICLLLSLQILHTTLGLVQSEKLFYSWDLTLQTETVRTFGRESVYCIQRGNLHDIAINEVIENLDIRHMLILRTKGSTFADRPIIPLFNSLSPPFECLQLIYRHLHGCWLHTKSDRSERAYSKDIPSMAESKSSTILSN